MRGTMRRSRATERQGCNSNRQARSPKTSGHHEDSTFSNKEFSPPSSSSVSRVSEPCLEPYFKPVDYVDTLAKIHEKLESASEQEKSSLYVEQSFVFRGLGETKLLRRSLRFARQYAVTVHERLVYSAWLKYEKRGEELEETTASYCNGRRLECPKTALARGSVSTAVFDHHCPCRSSSSGSWLQPQECSTSCRVYVGNDIVFAIDGQEIHCNRQKIAFLSLPFHAMLNGSFSESRMGVINFSENGISLAGMRAVDEFSKTGKLGQLQPELILEVLEFANRFCCEKLKDACDESLAALIRSVEDAHTFLDYGLEECASAVVAACLQVFLWELPKSLTDPQFVGLLCKGGRKRLMAVGQLSFAFYALLSHVSLEEDMVSDLSVCLLQGLVEFAVSARQKAFAYHQLGCVKFARKQYSDAHEMFTEAVKEGHTYSRAGLARLMCRWDQRPAAYSEMCNVISSHKPSGWMYQERSLYAEGKEKLMDLNKATELDPTLTFPYKYRTAALMDEENVNAAIAEINQILSFKVTPDCLELRVYCCLALQDYDGAVRDVRALLTLDPSYVIYSGRVAAVQLLGLLNQHVDGWTKADCWMQLYDRWSSVDDIGSLAVVHQMLESDPGKGLLFFRQSLLLLRLNCPKAAMRSLRLARQHASSDSERLVYEGWILYDTGHREEALKKAEESISLQRSFEAFFLKAYALADTSLDPTSSAKVVELLEDALKCPSDGLRKGQALNNLGSVYVDCLKYKLAADCYLNALKIRHTRAHQGLARVHFLEGDRKSAHEEMTKLIEKAQNNASAYEKRSEYCDRDMTMADLKIVTELDPLRTYPYRFRAAVLMDSQKETEAIAELSRAIAFKADLQLLHLRAAFHECINDIEGAIRDCRAALSVDPNHFDTLQLHGRMHNVHSREP